MKDISQKILSVKGTTNRLSFFAVAAFFVLITSASAFGQIVEFANTFSGAPASINATTVDSNLNSPVTLSRGAGLTAASSTVRFSSTAFASGTTLNLVNNDYYTFTVTAKPGFVINLNSQTISLTLSATATGPQSYALFTSVGGFTDVSQQVGPTLVNGSNTVTLPATGYNGLTSIEFRIYGFNASSGSGTGGPSFISLNGSVTAVAATPGTIQFNPTTYNPGEGAGSVMLTVTRTGGTDGAISATYTINNGSATGGTCPNADFDNSGSGGTVNFAAGSSTSQTITIPICDDAIVEGNEDFTVTLTGTNVSTTNATATVTIVDNDTAALPDLTISQSAPSSVATGGSFVYTLTVNNSGTSALNNVDVDFTVPSGVTENAAAGNCTSITLVGSVVQFRGCTVAASSSATLTINVTAPATSQTITSNGTGVIVDPPNPPNAPNGTIAESDESNNTAATITTAVGSTAATVNVGGRVTGAKGRGISGVLVTMTDGNGHNYSAYTDSSGNYLFEEVEVGQTLIFNVRAKRYNFAEPTQVVSLTEETITVNFTAYEPKRLKF